MNTSMGVEGGSAGVGAEMRISRMSERKIMIEGIYQRWRNIMKVKRAVGVLILAALFCGAALAADNVAPNGTLMYVGTYTSGAKSKGIYAFRLETPAGSQNVSLTALGVAAEVTNPSFLDVDLKRHLLFSVNEVDKHEGKPTGAVSAFSMNPQSGMLTLLNQQ